MMFIKKLFFVSVVYYLSVFNPNIAFSENYYVNNSNTNITRNGNSWDTSWSSFSEINWKLISPGDTLYISGGDKSKTYYEQLIVNSSGTEDLPITITKGIDKNHSGNVVIDGQFKRGSAVSIIKKNYITVKNLNILNAIDTGGTVGQIFIKSSKGIIIENCDIEFEKTHGGILLNGYPGGTAANTKCIIRNNYIYTPSKDSPYQTDGIYSQYNSECIYEKNTIIIRNENVNQHCDCIQLWRDNNITIRSNYVEQDNSKLGNAQGIYIENSTGNFYVYNNIAYGLNTRVSLLKFRNTDQSPGHVFFYNNIAVGGRENILYSDDPKTEMINNVIVTNSGYPVRFGSTVSISDFNKIDNNIIYNKSNNYAVSYKGKSLSFSAWKNLGAEKNGYWADPQININDKFKSNDYTLLAGRGKNLTSMGIFNTDFNDAIRPNTGNWSLGAIEYEDSSSRIEKVEGLKIIE